MTKRNGGHNPHGFENRYGVWFELRQGFSTPRYYRDEPEAVTAWKAAIERNPGCSVAYWPTLVRCERSRWTSPRAYDAGEPAR